MRFTPLRPIEKPSTLMSRLVGRLVRTPVTVRWICPLSRLSACPGSSDKLDRSAVLPDGVAEALPATAESSSPPFFFSFLQIRVRAT